MAPASAAACKLPSAGFRVLSGLTLRQEVRQRRSFRDQTGIQFVKPEESAQREPE